MGQPEFTFLRPEKREWLSQEISRHRRSVDDSHLVVKLLHISVIVGWPRAELTG